MQNAQRDNGVFNPKNPGLNTPYESIACHCESYEFGGTKQSKKNPLQESVIIQIGDCFALKGHRARNDEWLWKMTNYGWPKMILIPPLYAIPESSLQLPELILVADSPPFVMRRLYITSGFIRKSA